MGLWNGGGCCLSKRLRFSFETLPRGYVSVAGVGRCVEKMAMIQMRRKGTSVPKVAPSKSLLAMPRISRMRQAPCSPAVVTGSPTTLNEFLQLLQQPSIIHTPLYNLTDKLFTANLPVRYTPSSSPHVPQNGMCHPPLTVCLLPLATVLHPNNIKTC